MRASLLGISALALHLNALREAGCERVFVEKASGAQRDRPELKAALDYIRAGDTLAVWKLDRLARCGRPGAGLNTTAACSWASGLC